MVMTRKEYMDASSEAFRSTSDREARDAATHAVLQAYYAQFVTEETIAYAERVFGGENLLRSTDRALNDLGVNLDHVTGWVGGGNGHYEPSCVSVPFDRKALHEAHGSKTSSNSDIVCILKSAARIWIERHRGRVWR